MDYRSFIVLIALVVLLGGFAVYAVRDKHPRRSDDYRRPAIVRSTKSRTDNGTSSGFFGLTGDSGGGTSSSDCSSSGGDGGGGCS